MRVRTRLSIIGLGMAAGVLAAPASAYAVNADHADWTGYGWSQCTSGINVRTCYYDVYSSTCVEAAVVGTPLATCHVGVRLTVRVVPIANAAGTVIGCTSIGLSRTPDNVVDYDSAFGEFDNASIDIVNVGVVDYFGDGRPGAVEFSAADSYAQESVPRWLAEGAFVGSCARNATLYTDDAAGTVDVYV